MIVGRKNYLWDDLAERVRLAGLVHDVGKIAIPQSILRKPGPLDDEEWKWSDVQRLVIDAVALLVDRNPDAAADFLGPSFGLVLGLTYLFGFLGFYLWDWTARPLRSSRVLFLLRRLTGGTVLALFGIVLLDLWAAFFFTYFDPEMGPAPPITLTEAFTNLPGIFVELKDTIRSFKAIVDGEYDHLPEQAFYNVGTVEDAAAKAQKMAAEAA